MTRKGFTLLELIVVIIILGILASLGFSQYIKMVEKGRSAEARNDFRADTHGAGGIPTGIWCVCYGDQQSCS